MSTAKVKAAAATKAAPQAANDTVTQIEQAVAVGKETVEQVVKAQAETVEQVVKASKDAASKGYEKAVALTKDQVEAATKAQTVALKSYEDAVAEAKIVAEAFVKAGTIYSQGLQDLSKQVISLAQASLEDGVAATQQILAAKTLRELVDLQAGAAKSQLDRLIAESSRLSDLSVKLIEDSLAPLSERVNAAVDKLVERAA